MTIYLGYVILFVLILGIIIEYIKEKKEWNNGLCNCGGFWKCFDIDSHGGRGYKCNKCGEHFWLSWCFDKRKLNK